MAIERYEGEPQQVPTTSQVLAREAAGGESTLSISRSELLTEIADFLGVGRDFDALDTLEADRVQSILKKGLRQFYNPPPVTLAGKPAPYVHVWRFLKPTRVIVGWPSIVVGTNTVNGTYDGETGRTRIRASSAVFYKSMVGKYLVITGLAPTYGFLVTRWFTPITPSTYVSGEIEVEGNAACTAATFSMTANGDYRLPDDFAGLAGPITFGQNEGYVPLNVIGEGQIRASRQYNVAAGRPVYAAVRPVETDGVSGQRFELLLHPIPGSAYNFSYKCDLLPNALTDDNPYPLGGAVHAETILASCLAKAEIARDEAKGTKWSEFMDCLMASVTHDRRVGDREFAGYNADWSDPPREGGLSARDYLRQQGVRVSVGGVYY